MAELKAHSTAPESILSPDDGKLREEYNENRLDSLSDLAIAEVDKVSTRGGLEGFFEDFLHLDASGKLDRVENPDQLVSSTVERVMSVLENSGRKISSVPDNGSSVAAVDALLWKSRRTNVLSQIKDCKSEGKTSLSVLAGHEVFLEEAKVKVAAEYDEQRKRVSEAYDGENRFKKFFTGVAKSRWGSLGATALAGGAAGGMALLSGGISVPLTALSGAAIGYIGKKISNGEYSFLGHRANLTRERRLEKLDDEFKTKLQEKYDAIKATTEKVKEKETEKRNRMQSKIERKFKAAVDSKDKQDLWDAIKALMSHTGALGALDLSLFGITDEQDKILFLEALKNMPEILAGIENRKISAEKHQLQANVVEGARSQQTYIENPAHFSFKSLKEKLEKKNIPATTTEVKTADLIAQLSNDLQAQGVHLEEDVYGTIAQSFRGLTTDTARLVILSAYLKANSAKLTGCSLQTQSDLLKWIEDQDTATKGASYESYTVSQEKEVKDQFDVVKTLLPEAQTSLQKFRTFSAASIASRKISDLDSSDFFRDVLLKKDSFDRLKSDFPEKDKKELENIWENLLKLREILFDVQQKWDSEIGELKAWSTENNKIEKRKNKIIQQCDDALQAGGLTPDQINSLRKLQEKEAERADKHLEKKPDFTQFSLSTVTGLEARLAAFDALNFDDVFTKESTIVVPSLDERIQRSLHKEFQEQLESQCLKSLQEHDQFERIKTLPAGSLVEIDFREISGVTHLRLPNQLEGTLRGSFRVVRSDGNQVLLESDSHVMTLTGPCSDGTNPFKNAQIRQKSGTPDSGSWALAYNYKIL